MRCARSTKGLEMLTAIPAEGSAEEENVNGAVNRRLREMAVGLKEFSVPTETK